VVETIPHGCVFGGHGSFERHVDRIEDSWHGPDRAVRTLIGDLQRYSPDRDEELTVVFDRRPPGRLSRSAWITLRGADRLPRSAVVVRVRLITPSGVTVRTRVGASVLLSPSV
jgi:hypothetical protein